MFATTTLPRRPVLGISDAAIGMTCMAMAMLLLPIGDTFAKLLTGLMHPVEVTLARLVAQVFCLVPAALLLRRRMHGRMFSPIIGLSGALVALTLTSLIWAFSVMPLATAIAIFFVEPLILTALAGPLLGERIGPRRLSAVGVGLIGALIVIRPGAEFSVNAVLPLVAATAYALNMIVLRQASRTRSGLTVQCGATAYAALILAAVVLGLYKAGVVQPRFIDLPVWGWGAISAAGAFAAGSFVLIAEAFRRTEAGTLAPFQYLEIIGAATAGYLVFGDLPDLATFIGVTIILASGLYVFWREQAPENQASIAPGRRRSRRIRPR